MSSRSLAYSERVRFVILGLMFVRPLSLYDLVRAFEAGISMLYRASTGSVKRALDGLLADDLIEPESETQGARGRKAYRITDEGRAAFFAWMHGDPEGSDVEAAVTHRLFFLGLLPANERREVLERQIVRAEEELAGLERVQRTMTETDAPSGFEELATSQLATLDLGIGASRFSIDWLRDYARGL